MPNAQLPTDAPTRARFFFWFTSDEFLKRPVSSYRNSYEKFLWGDLWAKVVPERTTYRVPWGVTWRVPSSVPTSRLCSDLSSWEKSLRNPEEQEDHEKGTLSNQPQLTRATPTAALLGSWVLQPIEGMTSLGTDFEKRAKWLGLVTRVHWGTRCEGFCSKEGPHYWMEQSARNHLERDQVRRAPETLSRSCRQTSNNKPLFASLEIPWGFLSQAVLHWLSGGLCHARKCQFGNFAWEEKVWFAIA
jgi:hypothetical protein